MDGTCLRPFFSDCGAPISLVVGVLFSLVFYPLIRAHPFHQCSSASKSDPHQPHHPRPHEQQILDADKHRSPRIPTDKTKDSPSPKKPSKKIRAHPFHQRSSASKSDPHQPRHPLLQGPQIKTRIPIPPKNHPKIIRAYPFHLRSSASKPIRTSPASHFNRGRR